MRLTDLNTGEVFLGLAVPQKKKYPREIQEDGFYTMFSFGTELIAQIEGLNGTDYRVLFQLLSHLEFENWINVSHQMIANELGVNRVNVSRAIKKLVEKEIIEKHKDPSDGRRIKYRLNPVHGWMGDAKQWQKEMYNRKLEKVTPLFSNRKNKD
ncbi:Tagatose-6-phosphate kinase / 1-phosphofructokinase [Crocosphaera watsonii WH 0402]|uniref:Tagatose-6-phosphate kinase / 1-phosphofructokinase n=1 Tax=Crocosphaera watsonii WH 0402 TaxID=1284629 RepID=T2JHB1_CROWT|nr:helix-turn-helix domain-containing protein [Crocosphaera watsonii]CCQ65218.1 Tagatose-6-phosphate kinase / 1-phosphofructokinase [Crocosphaera watsonii WH 0402]